MDKKNVRIIAFVAALVLCGCFGFICLVAGGGLAFSLASRGSDSSDEQILVPTQSIAAVPSLAPVPGKEIIPIDNLSQEIPWLPMDYTNVPMVNYLIFNTDKPPFDNRLVRQAFSYAIDRDQLAVIAANGGRENVRPATSFTPPEVLGRDIYGVVGINYNPQKAKQLFIDAGYSDPNTFPSVTIAVNRISVELERDPNAFLQIANEMARMWDEHLDVMVEVVVVDDWNAYLELLNTDPPEMFRMGWTADMMDPDNFLREVFLSDSIQNLGHFTNADFDRLVNSAAQTQDPQERQLLYIQAEKLLCQDEAAIIPWYFTSKDKSPSE